MQTRNLTWIRKEVRDTLLSLGAVPCILGVWTARKLVPADPYSCLSLRNRNDSYGYTSATLSTFTSDKHNMSQSHKWSVKTKIVWASLLKQFLTVLKVCSSAALMFILTQCQRGKESTTMFKKQLLLINQERVLSQFPNSGKSVILQWECSAYSPQGQAVQPQTKTNKPTN